MQALPFVRVRDLPPSASFYSAITQPLGLRYISASPASIVFGDTTSTPAIPLFEVKAVDPLSEAETPSRPSRLVLSAHNPAVVCAFHAAALRANPTSADLIGGDGGSSSNFLHHQHGSPTTGGESHAKITDLEGNIMEVAYVPPPQYPTDYACSTVRRTQSTTKEVSRILEWNLDVATSEVSPRSTAPSRGGRSVAPAGDESYPILRRTVTTSTLEGSPRHDSSGLTTGGVIGTVLGATALGAAIGGALTYSMMRSDRDRAPRQDYDTSAYPPAFHRRSTFPDPYPDHRPRYVEVERTVERIHYPDEHRQSSSKKYPPPSYVARYSQAGGSTARSRTMDELDDRASRHSSYYGGGGVASRARGRSEAGSSRRPLMIMDVEHRSLEGSMASKHTASPRLLMETEYRSAAGSKHSAMPKVYAPREEYRSQDAGLYYPPAARYYGATAPSEHRSRVSSRHRSQHSHREPEVETYVSARSERSASTVRPRPPLVAAESLPIRLSSSSGRSKAPSRHSEAVPKMPSRSASYVSARHVALPESLADLDFDDAGSVAPSDSISCVGSRHSKRSYRH